MKVGCGFKLNAKTIQLAVTCGKRTKNNGFCRINGKPVRLGRYLKTRTFGTHTSRAYGLEIHVYMYILITRNLTPFPEKRVN